MILTTKAKYAMMAMIDLYEEIDKNKKPISLFSISQRQDISLSYLEQIFANLRKSGIVKSVKGPGGGYALAKNAQEISVADIILATGENIKMTSCKNSAGGCKIAIKEDKKKCKTHHLWFGLEKNIHDYLNSISIYDIYKNGNN